MTLVSHCTVLRVGESLRGRKEGRKEGGKEGRKKERKKERKEGRKEGTKEGRKECQHVSSAVVSECACTAHTFFFSAWGTLTVTSCCVLRSM